MRRWLPLLPPGNHRLVRWPEEPTCWCFRRWTLGTSLTSWCSEWAVRRRWGRSFRVSRVPSPISRAAPSGRTLLTWPQLQRCNRPGATSTARLEREEPHWRLLNEFLDQETGLSLIHISEPTRLG